MNPDHLRIFDADGQPLGVVRYQHRRGQPTRVLVWECAICEDNDDLALGWGDAVARLVDHLDDH